MKYDLVRPVRLIMLQLGSYCIIILCSVYNDFWVNITLCSLHYKRTYQKGANALFQILDTPVLQQKLSQDPIVDNFMHSFFPIMLTAWTATLWQHNDCVVINASLYDQKRGQCPIHLIFLTGSHGIQCHYKIK